MKPFLALLLATSLLALLPAPAAAQGPSAYSVVVEVQPPLDVLREDGLLVTNGKVEIAGDPSLYLVGMQGIEVRYKITKAPAWASVVVSPGSDVITLDPPNGLTTRGTATFQVSIGASDAMPAGVLDAIEVTVTALPSPLAGPRSAATEFLVQTATEQEEEACDEDHAAATHQANSTEEASAQPLAAPADEEDDLVVQSGAATPVGTWYALGGFAVAGAAVGAFAWRRRHA